MSLRSLLKQPPSPATLPVSAASTIGRAHLALLAAHIDVERLDETEHSSAELVRLFHQLQRFAQPNCFLEVGAFQGEFSRGIKAAWPEARVVAFEANPHNHAHYSGMHGFAQLGVDYRNQAVTDKAGPVRFQVQTRRDGEEMMSSKPDDSLLRRSRDGVEYQEVEVEGVTLADVVRPGERVSIWMDVEGAQRQALTGAAPILSQVETMIIEVEEHRYWQDQWLLPDVDDFLIAHGLLPVARDFAGPYQFNMLYAREGVLNQPEASWLLVEFASRLGRFRREPSK
jgi:FkbM family methyltransferase